MTDGLWNFLESEFEGEAEFTTFNKTNKDYIEIQTDQGTFIIEPIYNCDHSQIIDFAISYGNYYTNVREEPNIWFWEEIEKTIEKKLNISLEY